MLVRGLRSLALFACHCTVTDHEIVAGILIVDPENNPEQTTQVLIDIDKEPEFVAYTVQVPELFFPCSYDVTLKRCQT